MSIFSSLAKNVGGGATQVAKAVPLNSLPVPKPGTITPSPPPIKAIDDVNVKPIDPPSTKPVDPAKPSGGATTAVLGAGVVGASLLPTLLNSSVIQEAIGTAGQVGSLAVVADGAKEVANNLVNSITENPINMAFAVGGVALVAWVVWGR
jgi:hypothetical protein